MQFGIISRAMPSCQLHVEATEFRMSQNQCLVYCV